MALHIMDTGMGYWEGKTFKLREFPCSPGGGSIKGVDYIQTMSKIHLKFPMKGPLAELTTKDLIVEMSSWELKVRVEGRKDLTELLSPINGDFHGDAKRELTWWNLNKDYSGTPIFTIEICKKDHKVWSAIWKASGMNHHRKQHFGWTARMQAPTKTSGDTVVRLRAGCPWHEKDRFVVDRERLCQGLEDGQDNNTALYRIHFNKEALDKACEEVPIGSLFGADINEKVLKVFIRGDEKSPIILGQLSGNVIPDRTTWEIVKAHSPPDPLNPKKAPEWSNALQVKVYKSFDSRRKWPKIMTENLHTLERDAAPAKLEDYDLRTVRPPSPDRTYWTPEDHAKECKGKADNAFKKNEFRDAAVYYTRAIKHKPDDNKLFSNRSACYAKMKKFNDALQDANRCVGLDPNWAKAYFRKGQALRGLKMWEEALDAFTEGRFRDPENADWERETEKTKEEMDAWGVKVLEDRKLRREADMTTELNEATIVAEREAMIRVSAEAMKAGKSQKEAGELAMKGAEIAKERMHAMAELKKKEAEAAEKAAAAEKARNIMVIGDDDSLSEPPPYRVVKEDGTLHGKGFAHTDKGMYFMGMVMMNYKHESENQPWVEIRHPTKLRWSQGCGRIKMKIHLPESVQSAAEIIVRCTTTSIYVGSVGNADPIVEGEFERRVEPEGDFFSWFIVPDEKPPMLELTIDKDTSEVYQTFSYGTLLWPRLFNDDVMLGEGLFEADLTDLPPHLLVKFQREQARSSCQSLDERTRRKRMTEEEVGEETARNWNDEFARHGMGYRLDTNEDKMIESMRY